MTLEYAQTRASRNNLQLEGLVQGSDGVWTFGDLGSIRSIGYENPFDSAGRALQDLAFKPTGKDKAYDLAVKKGQRILQPKEVLEPLLDLGWEVSYHQAIRGGIWFNTTLSHPKAQVPDPIGYDIIHHGEGDAPTGPRYLRPAITVQADLQKSYSFRLVAGFYRQICTNGLTAEALNLGAMRISAQSYSSADLTEFSESSMTTEWNEHHFQTYPSEGFARLGATLKDINEGKSNLTDLPALLRRPIGAIIGNMGGESQQALIKQADYVKESEIPTITLIDILNVITNASKNIRVLWDLDSISTNVVQVMEMYAWAGHAR